MKFSEFIKTKKPLTEAKDMFPDVDVIKLDPDRVDVYDIVSALMPTLTRIAYTNLVQDKIRYNRGLDDEESDFEFTTDALDEALETLVDLLVDKFKDQNSHDRLAVINKVKSEFKDKLEEK